MLRGGLVLLLYMGACSGSSASAPPLTAVPRTLTLIATAEINGTPEPCGCQSDPLGDVARVATLVKQADKAAAGHGGALLVDAGGLRFGIAPLSATLRKQAELKADFLEKTWSELHACVGLGDEDVRFSPASAPPANARLCSNASGAPLRPALVTDVGGIKVGVLALLDPDLSVPPPYVVSDMIPAATRDVAKLRAEGAQVIVALVHATRPSVRKVLRAVPGITVAVVGEDNTEQGGIAEVFNGTIIVQPAEQAEKVAVVELRLSADGRVGTTLFASAEDRAVRTARIEQRVKILDEELAAYAKDAHADPAFVSARKREQKSLLDEKQSLAGVTDTPPPLPFAMARLVPLNRKLARDPGVEAALKKFNHDVAEANRAAGEKIPVPQPDPGEPGYIGVEACGDCHQHEAAADFWKTTVHAHAWKTIVDVDKQWSFDCISCHTTGYGQKGGSAMAHVDGLTDVQCEVCHGPGSLHAAKPKVVKMPVIAPDQRVCKTCHTPEHSDTFSYEAYLRDILGPTHGAKKRAALGEGPTGHALRTAALERAKSAP